MPWLRGRSRGFAAFALVAMALQIFGTFGHFHLADGSGIRAFGSKISVASTKVFVEKASLVAASETLPAGSDGDTPCPLCLVGNLIASAVVAMPPMLVLPIAYLLLGPPPHGLDLTGIDVPTSFWSRGPPRF